VLAVIIVLTTVMLGYFTDVKRDADTTKALIQGDIYYADILQQFKKLKGKQFGLLYDHPLYLKSPDGRFALSLNCRPAIAGVNINWFQYENDRKNYELFLEAQSLYDFLAQKYNIEAPERLKEMIVREIKKGNLYVVKAQSRLRQKNGIISYVQFADIVKRYQLESDDKSVSQIPWEKYFSFSLKAKKIDIAHSTPELIAYLYDMDPQSVREWFALRAEERGSLQYFIDNNGGNYAEKKALVSNDAKESNCAVHYVLGGRQYHFRFDYIQGEAKHFEFYEKH
jgi:hypothetical protein